MKAKQPKYQRKILLGQKVAVADSKEFNSPAWKNRTGTVSEVFFKQFKGAGKKKIFL